eukprot:NODE_4221_length_823_cov_16.060345_g4063_i0.p1 GENE.NODE_4221_length_823_cov_16.060345_g4063_i0~~NODE_4221_length_823_cov_16.060345_g4063_i0.p1  ORF type:complete len:257 (+),score=38.73 NODE_4221_length_823_cov_16.060345_g4063_i0:26-796(+)
MPNHTPLSLPMVRVPSKKIAVSEQNFRRTMGAKSTWNGPIFAPETNLQQCAKCLQNVDPISRVTVGHLHYHPRCLQCGVCNTKSESLYLDYKHKPICAGCAAIIPDFKHRQRRAAAANMDSQLKCKSCMLTLDGRIVTAMGHKWHSHCFRCTGCGGDFETDGVFAEHAGKPYHSKCVRQELSIQSPPHPVANPSSICNVCKKPITGDFLKAAGIGVCHKGCFKCAQCTKLLSGTQFYEDKRTGRPLCMRCGKPNTR